MITTPMQIPVLLALRLSEDPELEEGETGPLKVECAPIDDLKNPNVYVVKFFSKVSARGLGIVSEIIVAHLANYFGVVLPEFALIEISEAFAESLMSNPCSQAHILTAVNQNKHAKNFGSKLIYSNTVLPLSNETYTEAQLRKCESIFAFDALIYNADRTENAPNIFIVEDDFVVFDHEKAFNFLFRNPRGIPAVINFRTPDDRPFLKDHIFRKPLRELGTNFDTFIKSLENLDDNVIDNICAQVSQVFRNDCAEEINLIKDHLRKARENCGSFRIELMRALT